MGNLCNKDDIPNYYDPNRGYEHMKCMNSEKADFNLIFKNRPDLFIFIMENTTVKLRKQWIAKNKYNYIDYIKPILTLYQQNYFEHLVDQN